MNATKLNNDHALKVEDLNYTKKEADEIVKVLKNFLTDKIGYYEESWINPVECRRRSGFIPYSNNKGGLQAYTYGDQLNYVFKPTSNFKGFNDSCQRTYDYCIEAALEEEGITLKDYNKALDNDCADMIAIRDEIEMNFGEYEATCLETLLKLEGTGKLFVSFMLKASDAPYFRNYDDCIDFDIKFNTVDELERKLDELTLNDKVQEFIDLINY